MAFFFFFPPKYYAESGGKTGFGRKPIGSGPYRFVEWQDGVHIKLEVNPAYWGAKPQIQAINALNWWATEGGGEDSIVCSLIQDDPYGEAGQEGLDFAADQLGIDIAVTARFPAPPARPSGSGA